MSYNIIMKCLLTSCMTGGVEVTSNNIHIVHTTTQKQHMNCWRLETKTQAFVLYYNSNNSYVLLISIMHGSITMLLYSGMPLNMHTLNLPDSYTQLQ